MPRAVHHVAVHLDDTIVAIATPPGRGGIGVVRIAGPEAKSIAEPMLRLRHELTPNRALFGELIQPATGERMDEVVATWFAKPHSYTTDDIVEIAAHGAPVVLQHIVDEALARGARLAEPGEFTMRAFLNGRLDLTQAEAVRDLIESQTLFQAKAAAQQLEGALSNRLQPIKQKLVALIAVMEAGIDFAEDDVQVVPDRDILRRIAEVREPLRELERSFAYGRMVHEGITLAIVGKPNVGKSSLFNRLVERERAIVTSTPGTTRDLVTETVSLGGIPLRLVDTAGIRAATDEVESIGIQRSHQALADADLVLVVLEAGSDLNPHEHELLNAVANRRAIVVRNKVDQRSNLLASHGLTPLVIATSALTGTGIPELREMILREIRGEGSAPGSQIEPGFLTNARHQQHVREALAGLEKAEQAVHTRIPHEMITLDLYTALRPLDSITGQTTADDILNLIFSSFCIGK